MKIVCLGILLGVAGAAAAATPAPVAPRLDEMALTVTPALCRLLLHAEPTDREAREGFLVRGLKRLYDSAEWKELKENPYYKDTVSNITKIFLRAADCSDI